jgi:hypothetical protein
MKCNYCTVVFEDGMKFIGCTGRCQWRKDWRSQEDPGECTKPEDKDA